MCLKLGVPRSSFYAWRARVDVVTVSSARRNELSDQIKLIFMDRRKVYGCRRITADLNAAGIPCSVGLVASLMREMGLVAIQPRAWKRTTTQGDCAHEIPDLIGRDFSPDTGAPGERLVGDITYLRTGRIPAVVATVNTYAGSSKAAIRSAGVSQPSDFRGRPFSSSAIMASCSNVNWRRSAPLGRY